MLIKTTKTVLSFFIIAIVNNSYALELMDNDAMSATTAQDGLTITLKDFDPDMRLIWTDHTGVNAVDNVINDRTDYGFLNVPNAGTVMFGNGTPAGNFRFNNTEVILKIDADAGNGTPFININVQTPQIMTINTGDIFVAGEKQPDGSYPDMTKIMRNMTVEMGDGSPQGINLNIQIGNTAVGHFISAYGVIKEGIRVSNIGIIADRDVTNNEYGIGTSKMTIRDIDSRDLTFSGAGVNITTNGLVLTPSAGKKINVLLQDVKFGNLDTGQGIGDIALSNLAIGNNKITIVGH